MKHFEISDPERGLAVVPAQPVQNGHVLGAVRDDWEAIEVWLDMLREKNNDGRPNNTEQTYRYHLEKLRWYCEHVARVQPSAWSVQNVKQFWDFLRHLPQDAICATKLSKESQKTLDEQDKQREKDAVAKRKLKEQDIKLVPVARGEPGWTPFRVQPSENSQSDIKRFVHSIFSMWMKAGYIRVNPMLTGSGGRRKINRERSIPADLCELVIESIGKEEAKTFVQRQLNLRDIFIFEALRGMGLRASELVEARVGAFTIVEHPKTKVRYRVFNVMPETAKGGKKRVVPVPKEVWKAFVDYRSAFGVPASDDKSPLLLSIRTYGPKIGDSTLKGTSSRRFLKAWRPITTRQGLYTIVKTRLKTVADLLDSIGDDTGAERIRAASPHWLRHTFGKAKVEEGMHLRPLADAMGHASIDTTKDYTDQETLDVVAAYESSRKGSVATVD